MASSPVDPRENAELTSAQPDETEVRNRWEEIFEETEKSLFKWCTILTDNIEDAWDLFQEVQYLTGKSLKRGYTIRDPKSFVSASARYQKIRQAQRSKT